MLGKKELRTFCDSELKGKVSTYFELNVGMFSEEPEKWFRKKKTMKKLI